MLTWGTVGGMVSPGSSEGVGGGDVVLGGPGPFQRGQRFQVPVTQILLQVTWLITICRQGSQNTLFFNEMNAVCYLLLHRSKNENHFILFYTTLYFCRTIVPPWWYILLVKASSYSLVAIRITELNWNSSANYDRLTFGSISNLTKVEMS